MRLLICGSRHWDDYGTIYEDLREANIAMMINGGARGADRLAKIAARSLGIPVEEFKAHWKEYGKAAGPLRNQRMIGEGKPTEVWAYPLPGSKGTWDMVERAKKAGIPTKVKERRWPRIRSEL